MALTKKERIKRKSLDPSVPVFVSDAGELLTVTYKDPLWAKEKTLTILGMSTADDLVNNNIPMDMLIRLLSAKQYILSDESANMYEAYIEVSKASKGGFTGLMKGIKSIPSE